MKEKGMNARISRLNRQSSASYPRRGFTLIEVLIGSVLIMIIILGTLTVYTRSNKTSVDQQQFAEIQHDVRFSMFFISRDIKSAGAGLPQQFSGYFLEGINNDPNQSADPVQSDRLTILGNSDPLRLVIESYVPGTGTVTLEDDQFNLFHYTSDTYPGTPTGYINRAIIILPNAEVNPQNGELGYITGVNIGTKQIMFNQLPIPAPFELPNGFPAGGVEADYDGGTVHFIELKTYWLDVAGNYPGLGGQEGYLNQPGVIYVSQWNPTNLSFEHLALAQNIEDIQFQYHGDLDGNQLPDDNNPDGIIDGSDFLDWDSANWTDFPQVVAGIRRVRIWILGKTEKPYVSFSGTPPDEVKYIYGKPLIADSPQGAQADKHRRFLLESTANIRNMSLNIYNTSTI